MSPNERAKFLSDVITDNYFEGLVDAIYEECYFCKKNRMLPYLYFTEDGKPRCLDCETISLFK